MRNIKGVGVDRAGIAVSRRTTHTGISSRCSACQGEALRRRGAPSARNAGARQWLRPSTPLRNWPTRWTRSLPAPADVRDRLFEASTYLTRVRPEDIPDEDLRRTFIGVMEDDLSYAQPQGDEGRIYAPRWRITNGQEARFCRPSHP